MSGWWVGLDLDGMRGNFMDEMYRERMDSQLEGGLGDGDDRSGGAGDRVTQEREQEEEQCREYWSCSVLWYTATSIVYMSMYIIHYPSCYPAPLISSSHRLNHQIDSYPHDNNDERRDFHSKGVAPKGTVKAGRFKCMVCGQTFGRVEHLTRHERSHSREGWLRCEDGRCGKRFYRM